MQRGVFSGGGWEEKEDEEELDLPLEIEQPHPEEVGNYTCVGLII